MKISLNSSADEITKHAQRNEVKIIRLCFQRTENFVQWMRVLRALWQSLIVCWTLLSLKDDKHSISQFQSNLSPWNRFGILSCSFETCFEIPMNSGWQNSKMDLTNAMCKLLNWNSESVSSKCEAGQWLSRTNVSSPTLITN